MQRKLLGLAVAGALAAPGLALAQVEIYGFVNMAVGKVKYDAPTQFTTGVTPAGATGPASTVGVGSVSKWDVQSYASNYGIRGRENIGGGQTAWFQIEQNAPMERSNNVAITPASRNSAVGIQGAWGNAFMGQWTTPWADLDALWGVGTVGGLGPITSIIGRRETTGTAPNPNCSNGHLSPAPGTCDAVEAGGGVGHAFWKRVSQAIFYQSPVFAGVQVKLAYQTNEGKSTVSAGPTQVTADPSMWSASAQWAGMGGRVRVGAAFDSHKEFTAQGKTDTGYRLTGGWNLGFMDIGLAYEEMTYKTPTTDCDAKQYGIQVAVPIGQGAIKAGYSIAKDIKGSYTTPIATSATPAAGAAAAAAAAAAGFTTNGSCGFLAADAGFDTSDNGAKQWNLGFMDVGLAYEAMTYKTPTGDCDAKQYGVQVAIPIGQGAIKGAYSIAKDIKGDYTSPIAGASAAGNAAAAFTTNGSCGFSAAQAGYDTSNNGAKQWNIGYDYRFSKRTSVGIGYAAIDNDEAAVFTWTGMPPTQGGGGAGVPSTANTPMPGSDPSMFFVNMVHRF